MQTEENFRKLKKFRENGLRTRLRSEGINYHPSVYLDKHRGNRSYPATVITSVNARARRRIHSNICVEFELRNGLRFTEKIERLMC